MLTRLRMDRVHPNPNQPRKRFEAGTLQELATSIKMNGLMQPITVRPNGDGYQIVAGERRFRAHQILGAAEIDCIVQELNDQDVAIQAVIENMQRLDITPLEEANALNALLKLGFSEAALSEQLGIPEYRVARKLSILRLEEQIRQLVDRGHIPIGSAYEIAKLPGHDQVKLVQRLMKGGTTTNYDEVRAGVQAMLDRLAQSEFFEMPKATEKELATVRQMEGQIDAIVRIVNAGWKDGECVIAKKVAPDRVRLMAEKCAALKTCLDRMERQLRRAATQGEIALR